MTPGAKKGNAELHMVVSVLCKSLISQASALEKIAAIKEKCSRDMYGSFNEAFELLADSFDYIFFGGARKCVETIFGICKLDSGGGAVLEHCPHGTAPLRA